MVMLCNATMPRLQNNTKRNRSARQAHLLRLADLRSRKSWDFPYLSDCFGLADPSWVPSSQSRCKRAASSTSTSSGRSQSQSARSLREGKSPSAIARWMPGICLEVSILAFLLAATAGEPSNGLADSALPFSPSRPVRWCGASTSLRSTLTLDELPPLAPKRPALAAVLRPCWKMPRLGDGAPVCRRLSGFAAAFPLRTLSAQLRCSAALDAMSGRLSLLGWPCVLVIDRCTAAFTARGRAKDAAVAGLQPCGGAHRRRACPRAAATVWHGRMSTSSMLQPNSFSMSPCAVSPTFRYNGPKSSSGLRDTAGACFDMATPVLAAPGKESRSASCGVGESPAALPKASAQSASAEKGAVAADTRDRPHMYLDVLGWFESASAVVPSGGRDAGGFIDASHELRGRRRWSVLPNSRGTDQFCGE
mmetsp:Transcript_38052/g.98755  ORF Transcript_38052/g.98755 Transcript_38052/m.98755 type:complete len:420 (+) Transcript_38052:1639-2898(+)